MKFNLHGHSSPDWKRPPPPEFVPSPVRSGSARITFQLHAHTYTSSVKLHYNTTKTQTTTTTITIHITTFGMFRGGGGAATNIKVCGPSHKRLWNQRVCCHLSSTLPLPHPPDSCSSVHAFSDREDVQNSEQEEPLPLLHHWNLLPIRVSSLEDECSQTLIDSCPVDCIVAIASCTHNG